MVSLASNGSFRLGIDLGGSKTEVVVLDHLYQVRHRKRLKTPAHDYNAILTTIADLVAEADQKFRCQLPVGIGTPGAISPRSGLLRNSNTVCMNGRTFLSDLETRLQRPVKIQNDANCFTLSESRNGAGKSTSVVFGVIVGTGTGGGLVINGQLLVGKHRIAGEWGHNPLPWQQQSDGTQNCYCGKSNCIETFLSGPGLASRYFEQFGQNLTSEQIIDSACAGDSKAAHAMETYYDQFARALALVINILDPDIIVLGGGMSKIEGIYEEIPERLNKYVFSDYITTAVVAAEHGDASGVFGAAML